MRNFSDRVKLIFIPFLIIAISFTLGYSFLNWLFIITLETPINEDIVNFWLVFGLPWIPILIWLRPRIRLLKLKDKKGNLPFLYHFIAAIAIIVPTIIAQEYLVTATGKLTSLSNVNEISNHPLTKYYTIKDHIIDKRHIGVFRRTVTGGKNNEYLNFYIEVACPISALPFKSDSTTEPKAWLCYEFSKNISNHLSDQEKEQEYKAFVTKTDSSFKEKSFDDFVYLDRIATSDKRRAYLKAIQSKIGNINTSVILEAVNEPFEARNGGKLKWIFLSFGIGASIWFLMLIIPQINAAELKKRQANPNSSDLLTFYKNASSVRLASINTPVTLIIISINTLIFLIMVFAGLGVISFDGRDLLLWGANFRPKTIDGEWWRLVSNIFLHGG